MKIKYFFPFFVAVIAAMFTGCSDDNDPTYLDEIRVSQSMIPIPSTGGTSTIEVITNEQWSIVEDDIPEWLTITPLSGTGNGTISFSADAYDGREANLKLSCAGKIQHLKIIQGIATVSNATCAEVLAGPDSKTYRVTGTVTKIVNTTYGNWYMDDGTGELYIYGTLDAKGGTKNFLSWGLEVGDQITVEGPKTTYNGTVELVDVTVVKIEKSLIKCDSLTVAGVKTDELPLEGGEIVAHLTCKGSGVAVDIPAEAQSWLGVVASTVGEYPTVTFRALPNTGGDRSATVHFNTTDGKKNYSAEATITQKGAIVEVTVEEFLDAEISTSQYRITGVITELYTSDKQGKSFYVQDYTGKVLVYRAEGFIEAGAKVGDIVTVVGQRGAYKDTPQLVSGTFEDLKYAVTEVSIAEFLAKPDSKETYYMVTGTIDEIANTTYGNLYITDGSNRLYVYGCYPGYGATGDFRKDFLAAAGIEVGDKLTMIGYKDTYKEVIELCGGIYFSHEKAQ